jgi:hypothetical protein
MKFDIIFLSYDEPFAEEHWERLKEHFPFAQRVHGIKGILNAHKKCAKKSRTNYFFVVDGDAYILDSFTFDAIPSENLESDHFYMWRSRNAVNDLVYGNGGIKLFPRTIFHDIDEYGTDLFWRLPHKEIHRIASISRFNFSPFYSWRAGFRECVNLASRKFGKPRTERYKLSILNIWCNKGADRPFGIWCIKGARMGREYGEENKDNKEKLELFNDFDWLKKKFDYELKKGSLRNMA